VKIVKGKVVCDKGLGVQRLVCSLLQPNHFWLFPDLPLRKLVFETQHSFWDHHSFITAAAAYQPLGFGTTGEGNLWGRRKLLLSLGMLAAKPHVSKRKINTNWFTLAWGLCCSKEMSPSKLYCDDYYEYAYPCTPGVSYHGRCASINPYPSCCFEKKNIEN
jgi:hypothetical protein